MWENISAQYRERRKFTRRPSNISNVSETKCFCFRVQFFFHTFVTMHSDAMLLLLCVNIPQGYFTNYKAQMKSLFFMWRFYIHFLLSTRKFFALSRLAANVKYRISQLCGKQWIFFLLFNPQENTRVTINGVYANCMISLTHTILLK